MPDEFPFFIQAFLAPDGNFYDDWMYSPMRYDFHGSSAISMVIGGMLYTFTVGMPADLPTELAAARPTLTGQLSIPVLPIHNFPEFEQVYIKQVQASKRHAQLRDKALTKEAPSFVALFE